MMLSHIVGYLFCAMESIVKVEGSFVIVCTNLLENERTLCANVEQPQRVISNPGQLLVGFMH
jgi:hypothetical protein